MKYGFFSLICALRTIWVLGNTFYTVSKCPFSEQSWNISNTRLGCENGKTYHCLRTSNDTLVEMCIHRLAFDATKGCPFFLWSSDKYLLSQSNTCLLEHGYNCVDIANYGVIVSNQMYKYRLCQFPFPSTGMSDPSKARKTTVQKILAKDSVLKNKNDSLTAMNYTLGSGGIFVAAMLVPFVLVVLVLYKRTRLLSKGSRYMFSVLINHGLSQTCQEESIYDEIEETSNNEGPEPCRDSEASVENVGERSIGLASILEQDSSKNIIERRSTEKAFGDGRAGSEAEVEPKSIGSVSDTEAGSGSCMERKSRECYEDRGTVSGSVEAPGIFRSAGERIAGSYVTPNASESKCLIGTRSDPLIPRDEKEIQVCTKLTDETSNMNTADGSLRVCEENAVIKTKITTNLDK